MSKAHTSPVQQMDFLNLLTYPKKTSEPSPQKNLTENEKTHPQIHPSHRKLPKNQQVGFRNEYNHAMITLYIFGCLFRNEFEKQTAPEKILHEVEKAKKTQARYERYMPKASQKIIHYGRDVVDAVMYDDKELSGLRAQAENSKYPDKWRMYTLAQDTLNRMVGIIRAHNKD